MFEAEAVNGKSSASGLYGSMMEPTASHRISSFSKCMPFGPLFAKSWLLSSFCWSALNALSPS